MNFIPVPVLDDSQKICRPNTDSVNVNGEARAAQMAVAKIVSLRLVAGMILSLFLSGCTSPPTRQQSALSESRLPITASMDRPRPVPVVVPITVPEPPSVQAKAVPEARMALVVPHVPVNKITYTNLPMTNASQHMTGVQAKTGVDGTWQDIGSGPYVVSPTFFETNPIAPRFYRAWNK